jgi:hypothetical protein
MTTLTTNPQEHWETVIEQYLWGARCCVPASDAVRGYPATLLLLCVIDAIGNCLLEESNDSVRLDVLTSPLFNLRLAHWQVEHLKDWYRNPLVHTGTMTLGVTLDAARQGEPFGFDKAGKVLRYIHVPVLLALVEKAWRECDKTRFKLPSRTEEMRGPSGPVSSHFPGPSGLTNASGQISQPQPASPSVAQPGNAPSLVPSVLAKLSEAERE